jgi:vanillate O-demethylase ferredoxin subunit
MCGPSGTATISGSGPSMPQATFVAVVANIRRQTKDIIEVNLLPASGAPAFLTFMPGAHIDLHLRPGLVRQYSLCHPHEKGKPYSIGVLLDPKSRGGSLAVHALQVGQEVAISEPRNLFPLAQEADEHILLAGGIGVTPLLCMAQYLVANGQNATLHYFTRTSETVAFREVLDRMGSCRVVLHCIEDDIGSAFDAERDIPEFRARRHLYVCGPEGFIDSVREGAARKHYPDEAVHFEHFSGQAQAAGNDLAFEVQIERTGEVFMIPPGRSIADVMLEAGADIEVSCEQGMCGTCLVDVVAGDIEHRDIYQTDAEKALNQRIALCCSRARGRIVIDP